MGDGKVSARLEWSRQKHVLSESYHQTDYCHPVLQHLSSEITLDLLQAKNRPDWASLRYIDVSPWSEYTVYHYLLHSENCLLLETHLANIIPL